MSEQGTEKPCIGHSGCLLQLNFIVIAGRIQIQLLPILSDGKKLSRASWLLSPFGYVACNFSSFMALSLPSLLFLNNAHTPLFVFCSFSEPPIWVFWGFSSRAWTQLIAFDESEFGLSEAD